MLRRAIANWIYGHVACRHRWRWIGVRHYELLQSTTSERTTPMTAAARRCDLCNAIDTPCLVGTWELSDLTGPSPPPVSQVADQLIQQSLKEAPKS